MKRILIYGWLLILPYLWILTGCTDEDLMEKSWVGKEEVWVNLPFGCSDNDKVNITTRATYDLKYESMVQNVYIFIFANNERVYGRYFDQNTLGTNENLNGTEEKWYVNNMQGTGNTKGKIRMKVPIVSNAEIFMIANLDLNFLNLSEERLNMVRNKGDLEQIVVSLNQDIVERNAGLFMMTGNKTGVNVANNGKITVSGDNVTLQRLDAKVEVNVKVDQSGTIGLDGQRYVVKEFIPDSWEVHNLPDNCYLVEKETVDSEKEDKSNGYFNLPARKFETYTDAEGNGFSFYMMENRESANKRQSTGNKYHLRDMRMKNTDGTYTSSGNPWAYAPEFGTYLVLKGTLNMEVNPNSTAPQQLTADVVYHIHLGNFSTSKDNERNAEVSADNRDIISADNYDINRNTHYTYTVKIKGVNSIETEVQTSNANLAQINEPQPGASGNIYKTVEDTYVFDAHYGQRVYTLHVSNLVEAAKASTLSWYVKTPFGREGSPLIDTDSDQPVYEGLDYKWVEFMLNEKNKDNSNPDIYTYSDNNQWYPGTGNPSLMDVIQFTNLLKQEAPKYRDGVPNEVFDKNGDLKVTVFVNEYYYEEHPTEPDNNPKDLWKQFVNKPHRIMHILSNPQFSKDGESSVTNSSITIRQRAITTPYNINKKELVTAWGCETEDETYNSYWWFFPGESRTKTYTSSYTANTSRLNGLYNTGILWGVVDGNTFVESEDVQTNKWNTYLDFERKNDDELFWMKSEYKSLLYASMMRNRDNNGNGKIDKGEVRWYIASLEQLFGLFIGDMGLPSDAQLYRMDMMVSGKYGGNNASPINTEHPIGIYKFRNHVVSSTHSGENDNYPEMLWAEEGASTSKYRQDWGWYSNDPNNNTDPGTYSIRCVRNMGLTKEQHEDALKTKEYDFPAKLINMEHKGGTGSSAVYEFDLTNVNIGSLRSFYTTGTMLPSDEYNPLSRPYRGFVTGASITNYNNYDQLKQALEAFSFNLQENSGYRVPNVREAALMRLYCSGNDYNNWWNRSLTMVSTYYSMGKYGNKIDPKQNSKFSWYFGNNTATVDPYARTLNIRLVKDIEP